MAVGRQRLDKYYGLAKEKGYRARSAFKLLELNKKYGFLKDAHIAVDLCAAPGGWMQILAQEMPPNRRIIGVDLDPIRPLGGDTVSFVGDITTAECRRTLIGLLDGHQVDVFVHDGAPNFGTSKVQDHFVQNDLVLHALKLSSEFLKEGGAFVTKIFRSENYARIIKVLGQLFGQVDVTKPLSSRNESAEIFAVCRRFAAPEYVDPRLFDSSVLFGEAQTDDDEYKKILLSEYIRSADARILRRCVAILPDFECELVTPEFIEMFKDLKILHSRDIRRITVLRESILRKIKKGAIDVPVLADLAEAGDGRAAAEESEPVDALEEIRKQLEKGRKRSMRAERAVAMPAHEFFDDRIFNDFDSTECTVSGPEEEGEVIEVSSCSDSMEMTESEMLCAVQMKRVGEDGFQEATIDRYAVDSDDIVLPSEKRPVRMREVKAARKKLEVIGRKKARALRRANRVMKEIVMEEEDEEAVVYKKIFKSAYKKERTRRRLVYANTVKGCRFKAPKGRGKILCLDKRMKHDLHISRQRAKSRR